MLLPPFSVNHRFPSAPVVTLHASLLSVGIGYSVICPAGVILPIWSSAYSVNQRLPSGPTVIPIGWLLPVGIGYSVICPAGVIRPIRLP